jgi:GTP-binding protein
MTGFKFEEFAGALRARVDEITGRSRHATPEQYQDILDDELKSLISKDLGKLDHIFISSVSQQGLTELKDALWKSLQDD